MESRAITASYLLQLCVLVLLCFFQHSSLVSSSTPTSTSIFPNEAFPTKSGYLPIQPKANSAIFYAFYEAQNSSSPLSQTPLLIWLQGGPGCSSMTGNFLELGPYRVIDAQGQNIHNLALVPNLGSWNRIFGLVFLDNPIGTGFSIASKLEEIPRDQHTVAKHLFAAITAFIELDPVFKTRPLFITGESYAGKYVPAIGYYILKKNMQLTESKQVNLKGVAIGNGLTDPVTQVQTHAVNAHFSGFINERQKNEMEKVQLEAVKLVNMRKWKEATEARNAVLELLKNMTGLATLYDYTRKEPYQTWLVTKLMRIEEVKKALKVNESIVFEDCSDTVEEALHEDVMKSVKHMVELLVKNSKVLLYQGFLDLRDGVVSTEAWVRTMKWEEIGNYLIAERKLWKVNGVLAGYVQKWGSFSNAVVLGVGHLVPTDQAVNSQALIEDWVLDEGIFASHQGEDLALALKGEL